MSDSSTARDITTEIAKLADAFGTSASIDYSPNRDTLTWHVSLRGLHLVTHSGVIFNDPQKGTREWGIGASRLGAYGSSLAEAFDKIDAVVNSGKPYMLSNTEIGWGADYDDDPYITIYEGVQATDTFRYGYRDGSAERIRTFLNEHYPHPVPPAAN